MNQGAHGSRALHVALAGAIAAAGIAAAAGAWWPGDDVTGTRIALEDLRSRAAALALVAREGGAGRLPDTYVRMQARQLAGGVQDAGKVLADAPATAAREAAAGAARLPTLQTRLEILMQGAPEARLAELGDGFARLSDGFGRLARALATR